MSPKCKECKYNELCLGGEREGSCEKIYKYYEDKEKNGTE